MSTKFLIDKAKLIELSINENAEEIERLNKEIGLPSGLREMGVTEDMIPHLVQHSMTDPSNATTPRLPSQEEGEKLFLAAM